MKNKILITSMVALSIILSSCNKEEYTNPSQASDTSVITDANGIIALCNGLQYRYSVGRQSPIYTTITANGLTTGELIVLNAGNTDELYLQSGGATLLGNNAVMSNLWEQSNIIKSNANLVLNNVGVISDPNTKNVALSFAKLYRGLALLQLGTYWEKAPISVEKNAPFLSRSAVLLEAVKSFEEGTAVAASITTIPSGFVQGVDFKNTFAALTARTYLMIGDYTKALAAANLVDLTKKSEWLYDEVSKNPIFFVSYSNVNVCEPKDLNLGLSGTLTPAITDGRLSFYVKTTHNYGKGFFSANSAKIPMYIPGEVILIKAECYARQSTPDLTNAQAQLDLVLTKNTDIYGVNAALPAYSGVSSQTDILNEIYKNRCIELYNSGLKLEDSRRFGRPAPGTTGSERNRNFYPYPNSERDNNTNCPVDPSI